VLVGARQWYAFFRRRRANGAVSRNFSEALCCFDLFSTRADRQGKLAPLHLTEFLYQYRPDQVVLFFQPVTVELSTYNNDMDAVFRSVGHIDKVV
jgi:hypothetical protein